MVYEILLIPCANLCSSPSITFAYSTSVRDTGAAARVRSSTLHIYDSTFSSIPAMIGMRSTVMTLFSLSYPELHQHRLIGQASWTTFAVCNRMASLIFPSINQSNPTKDASGGVRCLRLGNNQMGRLGCDMPDCQTDDPPRCA